MPGPDAPLCAAPDPAPRSGRFEMPAGACDCHAHVFSDASKLVENRVYTPSPASLEAYRQMLKVLRIERAVIVQPSVYGTDNRATLDAVAEGGDNYRAVVVLDENVSPGHLRRLHDQGARGARINALFSGSRHLEELLRLGRFLAEQDWHMQMLIDVSKFEALADFVRAMPVPVVIDHMGHTATERGVESPGFQALLRLMGEGRVWTKLSGSYRVTARSHPPYEDVLPFARALVEANPDQCLWASDWPHPHIPVEMPNDGELLDMLGDWVPDRVTRHRILVDNPARLYGFGP